MKKTLYYVVDKESYSGTNELNGLVTVSVYEMIDNKPVVLTTVECTDEDNIEDQIQNYLDDNGFGDDEFNFIQL
jgi:hypothetical protein